MMIKYFDEDDSIKLFFDKELADFLDPDEILYLILVLRQTGGGPLKIDSDYVFFCETSAYRKLFKYYADEMPYEIAKCRTGEPDMWILDRLLDRVW